MRHRLLAHLTPLLLLFACCLSFCSKERFTTDSGDSVEFSTDTLRFDTVFTELGSATRILKIYNPHQRSIRISNIYLENGAQSKFRINVDGLPGAAENVEIAPNDSLYVFAEVTINPDAPPTASPFILDENLIVEVNGNVEKVVLEAWGQNAVYLPSRYGAGGLEGLGCNGGEWVWNDPRPYVIYGILVIDACTVRIPAGARVYVHGGLAKQVIDSTVVRYNDGLLVFSGTGRLIVEGTLDNPVIFEGDRLEPEFDDVAGQWTGILLDAGTSGHRVEHCIVRNSIIGFRVDSAADLTMRHTQIYNTSNAGFIAVHAKVTADNCLFYNNGGYCIQLEYGGDYRFRYCTAANYGVDGEALRVGTTLCLDEFCSNYVSSALSARFINCIFAGSRPDQITLFDLTGNPALFDYHFENCIVRVRDLLNPNDTPNFFERCDPCRNLVNGDTLFLDIDRDNYRLDSLNSIANGYARPLPDLTVDLEGLMRDPVMPDAGAFERQ
jgi:hypothetical protein